MRLARNQPAIEDAKAQATADLTIEQALHGLARPKPLIEIESDHAILPAITDHLPAEGQCRLGVLDDDGMCIFEYFGVIEDSKHPGYYHIGHVEHFPGEDAGAIFSYVPRAVRADSIMMFFEGFTRHPNLLDRVEWEDRPASTWPFPSDGYK
jgi:hypothetical protein